MMVQFGAMPATSPSREPDIIEWIRVACSSVPLGPCGARDEISGRPSKMASRTSSRPFVMDHSRPNPGKRSINSDSALVYGTAKDLKIMSSPTLVCLHGKGITSCARDSVQYADALIAPEY